MIKIEYKPFGKLTAEINKSFFPELMRKVGTQTEHRLRRGMARSKVPSVPLRQYPAIRTGELYGSIQKEAQEMEVEIGTTVFYGIYLRTGTTNMQRRKMSDKALQEALPDVWKEKPRFARYRRV